MVEYKKEHCQVFTCILSNKKLVVELVELRRQGTQDSYNGKIVSFEVTMYAWFFHCVVTKIVPKLVDYEFCLHEHVGNVQQVEPQGTSHSSKS